MASVIHIAEVAAILAVAYGLGWVIGYIAHRLLARAPVVATVPAERLAAVTAPQDPDALVKAPVIDPVPGSVPPPASAPSTPIETPVLAVMEPQPVKLADPAPILAPMAIPIVPPPPPMRVDPLPPRLKPEPIPEPEPEPVIVLTAMPTSRPGEAWAGAVRGRGASHWGADRAEVVAEPVVVVDAPVEVPVGVPMTIDLGPVGPDSTYGEPIVPTLVAEPVPVAARESDEAETVPQLEFELEEDFVPAPRLDAQPEPSEPLEEVVAEPVGAEAPPPPPPAPAPTSVDEDAAMRAIEGGWSRVRTRAMPNTPEGSDVGAAVAAAQSAVEQVLAQAGIEAKPAGQVARPKGLPRPRAGIKDDLKRINGLGALDESTLNNLGVYHFDQIAGWDPSQVVWMENHVFARGRIGHENWQQQARDLAAVSG